MATENKFDKLRSMVHQGVPMEKRCGENSTGRSKSVDTIVMLFATAKKNRSKIQNSRSSCEPAEEIASNDPKL